jgi:hypothetical protein
LSLLENIQVKTLMDALLAICRERFKTVPYAPQITILADVYPLKAK